MLIIRLQRVGKKNEPTFRVVLTDSKNGPKSGKFLEILGSYDARDKNESKVDAEKVKYWIAQGAQLSDTVRNFLINQKVIEGKKVNVLPKKTPIVKEGEEGEAETPENKEEAPVEEKEEAPVEKEEAVEEEKVETPKEEVKSEKEAEEPKKDESNDDSAEEEKKSE